MTFDKDAPIGGASKAIAQIAATKILMSRKRANLRRRKNLWDQALDLLSREDRTYLDFHEQNDTANISHQILADIEAEIEVGKQTQWRFRKRNGDEVTVREMFEKVAKWVTKFIEVGNVIADFDPVHTSVPWAAVRFFLQVAVNDVERYGAMMEGVEVVAAIVARYAEVEKNTLIGRSSLKTQLENGLVKLYAAVLKYLVEARRYYGASTGKRIAKALVPTSQSTATERLDRISKQEDDVFRLVNLVQAENQANRLMSIRASLINLEENILQAKSAIASSRRRLLDRLGATYTNDNYDGSLSLRQEGTASWIFDRPVFQKWVSPGSAHSRLLWIHGPPGFGKSVLAASVVEYMRNERPGSVAYFFCVSENEAKRDPGAILTSWIAQLVEQNDDAVKEVSDIIKVEQQGVVTKAEQWKLFRTLGQRIKGCTFIIDGFDECTSINTASRFHTDDARSQFLQDLIQELSQTRASVLIVSRDTGEIRAEIFREESNPNISVSDYGITQKDTHPDIQTLSQHVVDFKLAKKSQDIRTELATKAADKAEGMFLWVHLLSQKLKPGVNAKKLNALVSQMPAGLEQAYERDLDHIYDFDDEERERAISILRWVLFAARPLTVRQLVEALILSGDIDDDETYPEDELPDSWKINYVDEDYVNDVLRQSLGSLIELKARGENEPLSAYTVHFVHYSVKEYLLQPNEAGVTRAQAICFPDNKLENDRLARLCIQYLCYDVFGQGNEKVSLRKQIKAYPFLTYAAQAWYRHVLIDNTISPGIVHYARKLLDPNSFNWVMWSRVFEVKVEDSESIDSSSSDDHSGSSSNGSTMGDDDGDGEPDGEDSSLQTATSPMYYACLLGLLDVVKKLHSDGVDINAIGGTYGTPLQAAIVKNHTSTAEFLIRNGADVNLKAGLYSYAIHAAAWAGTASVFRLLLESEASVDVPDDDSFFPIHFATYHPEVLQICLDMGVELNTCDGRGRAPLYWAAIYGKVESARMLLDAGIDINFEAENAGPALSAGIYNNNTDLVELLLNRGARMDTRDANKELLEAARFGRDDMIKLLLDRGADLEAVDYREKTPLLMAATMPGYPSSARILLERGASIEHADKDGWTVLHYATGYGHEELVQLFLEHGADADAEASSALTPLMLVSMNESLPVMNLLLQHGADPRKYDINGNTLIDHAIQHSSRDFILHLLSRDTLNANPAGLVEDPGAPTPEQMATLQTLIFTNDEDKVNALLEDIPVSDSSAILNSALHVAALSGSASIVETLISKGASVKSTTSNQRTALHYAAFNGHLDVVKSLLNHGSSPSARDVSQSSPLDLAIQKGMPNSATVQYLIQEYGFGPAYPEPSAALLEAWKELPGTFEGSYTYSSWNKGQEDTTSLRISPWGDAGEDHSPFTQPPFITGRHSDEVGHFDIFGYLHGDNGLIWAKLYENAQGWVYSGELNQEDQTIKGSWGTNPQLWHGAFTVTLTPSEEGGINS